jgi:hypothetical protein
METKAVISPTHPVKRVIVRVGHDAVWLAIAGLFCIVEGAVKVTEYTPLKAIRSYRARHPSAVEVPTSSLAVR